MAQARLGGAQSRDQGSKVYEFKASLVDSPFTLSSRTARTLLHREETLSKKEGEKKSDCFPRVENNDKLAPQAEKGP